MLSKDKLPKLEASIDAWAADEKIPQAVIDLVYEMAQENPTTREDKIKCCAEHLWSTDLIEWYDRFILYLSKSHKGDDVSDDLDIVGSLRAVIETLQRVVSALEAH